MNKELVNREYLRDAFDNLCCHNCKTCRNFRSEDSFYKCNLIERAPTVETERPQGEWILSSTGYWECSECKKGRLMVQENFCPNCGVYMRKGGAE